MNSKYRPKFGIGPAKSGQRPATLIMGVVACCFILCGMTINPFAQDRRDGRVRLPDLSVGRVYPRDFGLLVSIVNGGSAASGPCEVTLFVYDGRGALLWQKQQPLKSLLPSSSEQLVFTAGRQQWSGHRFQLMVDSGNTVIELNETNNRTAMATAPQGSEEDPDNSPKGDPGRPAMGSATVDLAAINIFPANDGKKKMITGVIRNVGKHTYIGTRQAKIALVIQKDGRHSEQTLGTVMVPAISAGSQQFVSLARPPEFDQADAYKLTLTISAGDDNTSNDSKTNSSAGYSVSDGSSDVDLEAAEVVRVLDNGTARIKGLVRNVGSQRYKGEREVRVYFIDQSGSKEQSTIIVSRAIENLAAGAEWEIRGDLPASLKKVKHFLLRLSISEGDSNRANDVKTRPFGNL